MMESNATRVRTQRDEELFALMKPFLKKVPENFVLDENSSLKDDIGIDSADLIDLAMTIEERYKITISDEQVDKLRTIGDLLRVIESQAGGVVEA